MYAFFYGLLTGLLLSLMLGTVFFCLVQNSITNGFKSGIFISTGVIISDIILIVLSYFNAYLFPSGGTTELIVRICGALFLLIMGISNLRSHKKVLFPKADSKSPLILGSKGFMLNILNPANYFSWLAVAATLSNVLHFTNSQRWLYYAGALCSIFGIEMLISYGASWLKKYISATFLQRLDMVLGIVFIIFSLLLLKPLLFGKSS
jgi:threonine/homoserine/homoserine lactone efflux protein